MTPQPRAGPGGLAIIELLIVLVIVAILLAIAIPQFGRVQVRTVVAPDSVVAPNASGPLTVRVTGWRGRAVPGVTVHFEATGRGGAVTPTTAATDSTGTAATTWIVRDTASGIHFTAAVEGQKARASVPVRVAARPAAAGATTAPAARTP